MKKYTNIAFAYVLVSLVMLAGIVSLAGCPQVVKPSEALSPLQDAYAVRDSIIIAKQGLVDARRAGKLSKKGFDDGLKIADDADVIVMKQIQDSHNGRVVTAQLTEASRKIDQVAAVNGGIK